MRMYYYPTRDGITWLSREMEPQSSLYVCCWKSMGLRPSLALWGQVQSFWKYLLRDRSVQNCGMSGEGLRLSEGGMKPLGQLRERSVFLLTLFEVL